MFKDKNYWAAHRPQEYTPSSQGEGEREREGERNSARCTKARNLCMDAWATACTAKPVYIYIYANACTRVVVGVGVGGGVGEGVSVLEDQLKSR